MKNALQGILGIILAGILYALLPIHALFLLVGACYLASGISEMMIRYEFHPSPERLTMKRAFRDLADGFRYLTDQKALLAMLAAILFINFFFVPLSGNFLPYFVKTGLAEAPSYLFDNFLTPEQWSSAFEVCVGISTLIGAAILSGREQADHCGKKVAGLLCAIAAVLILLTIGYVVWVDRSSQINVFLISLSLGFFAIGFLFLICPKHLFQSH